MPNHCPLSGQKGHGGTEFLRTLVIVGKIDWRGARWKADNQGDVVFG